MKCNSYFDTHDLSLCCGCRACEQACPKNAITMVPNEEGFICPQIHEDLCVGCNICKKVCPVAAASAKTPIRKVYQLQNKDEELLRRSSSGGVFISLANFILSNGGIVFGTVLNENNEAVLVSTTSKQELQRMQGSKYVFSNTQQAYSEAEQHLKAHKLVLFTGAPCQIAGLKGYLRKDYENLITMDFLCHGMPSPEIFKENIRFLSKKYKGKIENYQFRDKSLKGWGHVTSFHVNGKKHYEAGKLNAYFCGFIKSYLNRYSCYSCHFRGENRCSDITVGDFWGCGDPQLNLRKGVSFAALNTVAGEEIFSKLADGFICTQTTADAVSKMNSTLLHTETDKIPEVRRTIYKELGSQGYERVTKKHLVADKRFLLSLKMKLDIILKKIKSRKQ